MEEGREGERDREEGPGREKGREGGRKEGGLGKEGKARESQREIESDSERPGGLGVVRSVLTCLERFQGKTETPLHKSCAEGDEVTVQLLLQAGSAPEKRTQDEREARPCSPAACDTERYS